ncbi:hypothetical protein Y1Q_0012567 [Alligator mississippiensis]|uniref:Protein FAM240B n=2 Tax=Alligator mississippiensis TaxID=8496 RepID=A0A151M842_ALLMI|nr:hypothetical protein Y1Q_0012567 [Alligator mississippiensis]
MGHTMRARAAAAATYPMLELELPPLPHFLPCAPGQIQPTSNTVVQIRPMTQAILKGLDHESYNLLQISKEKKMNSQYVRHEVRGCETSNLRNFWEKAIEKQTQYLQTEKERQQKSALTKLRNEWMERLEKKLKMLRTQTEDSAS